MPRGRLRDATGEREWKSASLPAYKRLSHRAEALIAQAYLAGMTPAGDTPGAGQACSPAMSARTWSAGLARPVGGRRRQTDRRPGATIAADPRRHRRRSGSTWKATAISLLIALGIPGGQTAWCWSSRASRGGESEAAWRQLLDDLRPGPRSPSWCRRRRQGAREPAVAKPVEPPSPSNAMHGSQGAQPPGARAQAVARGDQGQTSMT